MENKPINLAPVLAKIKQQNDLGTSYWSEVVYWSEEGWQSYGKKFEKNAIVESWMYVSEVHSMQAKLEAATARAEKAEKLILKCSETMNKEPIGCHADIQGSTWDCSNCKDKCEFSDLLSFGNKLKAVGGE